MMKMMTKAVMKIFITNVSKTSTCLHLHYYKKEQIQTLEPDMTQTTNGSEIIINIPKKRNKEKSTKKYGKYIQKKGQAKHTMNGKTGSYGHLIIL